MKCENFLNFIEDFVENELDAATADQVSMHIFACENCEHEFEKFSDEKKLYSQFLFEIEPPKNLSQMFQARLENVFEAETPVADSPKITFAERLAQIFSLQKPLPLMAALSVVLLLGCALFWLKNPAKETANANGENSEKVNQFLPVNGSDKEIKETQLSKFHLQTTKQSTESYPKIERKPFEKIIAVKTTGEKPVPLKTTFKKKENLENSAVVKASVASEEQKLRIQELQTFEQGTAKQMEKIEMLLRSFRNARFSEETEQYEVSYEKQQARKLLENNEKLRAQAEKYGDFYAKDMLDKVEPYLLDIANLENNPSTELVLDIKQRVRNQNLIAGLQVF